MLLYRSLAILLILTGAVLNMAGMTLFFLASHADPPISFLPSMVWVLTFLGIMALLAGILLNLLKR